MSFFPKSRVIVPVDFSDRAFRAAEVARELVSEPEQVTVVHVLPPLTPLDPGIVWEPWNEQMRLQHARESLEKHLPESLKGAKITISIGDPARTVTTFAEETGAELIVLSSHGRTGAARLLIGSVAERIVRHAPCPVLVLRQ